MPDQVFMVGWRFGGKGNKKIVNEHEMGHKEAFSFFPFFASSRIVILDGTTKRPPPYQTEKDLIGEKEKEEKG